MVQTAQDRQRCNPPFAMDWPMDRRILGQGEVSAAPVVVLDVALKDTRQVLLAQNDDVVEALAPDRADQPFGLTILPR